VSFAINQARCASRASDPLIALVEREGFRSLSNPQAPKEESVRTGHTNPTEGQTVDTNSEFQSRGSNQIVHLVLDLGDAAELTLGGDGRGSEDKRKRYA
jgi:hypothetical protein